MGLFDSIFGGGGNASLPNIEDLRPLVQAQANINRLDQTTPFGSYTFNKPNPLSFDEWKQKNPMQPTIQDGSPPDNFYRNRGKLSSQGGGYMGSGGITTQPDYQSGYNDYLSGFDDSATSVGFEFSPELQSLFDKQFSGDAYQGYADDYMSRYNQLLDPYRQQETDRFQQSMVNRGIPEGSDVYGDYYRPIGDQRSRADLMAAQAAQGTADNRVMQDYNRLITAMGGSAIPYQPVDVMGPANMSLNAQMSNIASQNQASSNLWNSVAGLGGAMALGGTGIFGP